MMPATIGITTAEKNVDGDVLAMIAIAISLAVRKPHTIVSIQPESAKLEPPLYVLNPWSMEGRFQHFGSHKVRG